MSLRIGPRTRTRPWVRSTMMALRRRGNTGGESEGEEPLQICIGSWDRALGLKEPRPEALTVCFGSGNSGSLCVWGWWGGVDGCWWGMWRRKEETEIGAVFEGPGDKMQAMLKKMKFILEAMGSIEGFLSGRERIHIRSIPFIPQLVPKLLLCVSMIAME